ncbi:MAG: hypothetical protein QNK40_13980 [Desulfobacterales bacterium]|nr:hypothetical protein [Desulfobacterales bacterium]
MPGLYRIRIFIFFLWGLLLFGTFGCTEPPDTFAPDYLIKTGSITLLPVEFAEELDLKLSAYPYDYNKNPMEYNRLIFDLVSILSEESVLLAAAHDSKILVSDSELAAKESFYREDYPEDSFEQMLLENAISYPYWKKKIKDNLVIDKFIQQELKEKVEILSEDVVSFYNRHRLQEAVSDEKKLLSHLRNEKSQEFYNEWIMGLKKQYPVDINKKALARFLMKMENNKGQIND